MSHQHSRRDSTVVSKVNCNADSFETVDGQRTFLSFSDATIRVSGCNDLSRSRRPSVYDRSAITIQELNPFSTAGQESFNVWMVIVSICATTHAWHTLIGVFSGSFSFLCCQQPIEINISSRSQRSNHHHEAPRSILPLQYHQPMLDYDMSTCSRR